MKRISVLVFCLCLSACDQSASVDSPVQTSSATDVSAASMDEIVQATQRCGGTLSSSTSCLDSGYPFQDTASGTSGNANFKGSACLAVVITTCGGAWLRPYVASEYTTIYLNSPSALEPLFHEAEGVLYKNGSPVNTIQVSGDAQYDGSTINGTPIEVGGFEGKPGDKSWFPIGADSWELVGTHRFEDPYYSTMFTLTTTVEF